MQLHASPECWRNGRVDPATRGVAIVGMSGTVVPSATMLRYFDLFLPKPVMFADLDAILRPAH
ncbi:hypothetical protein [Sandaracinus amylolyticus]|uniref:hypothetical protein n=1 Tax=Sandaracinus amylolyticus TaxID=927083 RepID=UPI001F1ABCE8|nr:hypothetical protein [Sandaracinus amylolyticus]